MAKPGLCLCVVLWDASAVLVHDAEVVLRGGITLVRRLAKPRRRLRGVLLDALSGGVHGAEAKLRVGVALVRSLSSLS